MKKKKITWEKYSPTNHYLKIPNTLVTELSSNADALLLLLTILSNGQEFFKSKELVYERIGWNPKSNKNWLKSIAFLQEKGYAQVTDDSYLFSNIPKYPKIMPKKFVCPPQPENSSFTPEEWEAIHMKHSEVDNV